MAFQTPITIQKAVQNINHEYFLPSIQRELVWKPEQIERLFDSILRGYPIGSFLFWKVKKENCRKYQFYRFVDNYNQKHNTHNEKAIITEDKDLTGILDGQQRLTSLYIGLYGTYAYKIKYKQWDNPHAFPTRKLYLNITIPPPEEDDLKYDFKFLTEKEAKSSDDIHWFQVGKILEFTQQKEIFSYLVKNGLGDNDFAGTCLFDLYHAITVATTINFYLEEDQDLDKVLNIFIRVNSGGTQLSYSDLLLSVATAQWKKLDARQTIHTLVDELNEIRRGFSFDKDFVLKSSLVLSDVSDVKFKVSNFDAKNMSIIETAWPNIETALKTAANLVGNMGFDRNTLTSNNAIIPIAYHLLKLGFPKNYLDSSNYKSERETIRRWLLICLIKGVFGDQADTVLSSIRNELRDSHQNKKAEFPYDSISARLLKVNKSLRFEDEEIKDLLHNKWGQKYTFSVLSILYPTLDFKNIFHQDHIFPKSFFTRKRLSKAGVPDEDINFCLEHVNDIGNLQLLEGILNQEKSSKPFKEWFEKNCPTSAEKIAYCERHYIPDVVLDITKFPEFFRKREKILLAILKKELQK